jgi:acyl dehydratase
MTFDPRALLTLDIPETVQTYGPHDCALYALGVGAGMDPFDPSQLALVDEARLRPLPSMAVVLGYAGFWIDQLPTGINVSRALHGEQGLRIHASLPRAGTIRRKTRVTAIIDKGVDKGALVRTADTITDAGTGKLLAALTSSILCRSEGGCGATQGEAPVPHQIPPRAPDGCISIPTSPQQALIYSLSGDRNPLHTDPATAQAAGFPGPILHGLASYGIACLALVRELCGGDPARARALDARFTRPLFPGEPLALEYWIEAPGLAAFKLHAIGRGVTAIDNGRFEFIN